MRIMIYNISTKYTLVPPNMEKMETDQEKTELNKLNMHLVEKLRSSDNAFSLGESTDGVACVRYKTFLQF